MAWPLQDGGWWTTQCWIHVVPWLSVWCECFFFAIRPCIWLRGWIPADFALDPCNMSTLQGSCGELYCTIGFCIMVFQEAWGIFKLHKRWYYLMDSTGIWLGSPVNCYINDFKYFRKHLLPYLSLFLFLSFLPFTICVTIYKFFSPVSDVWWTQKMSSVTSSQSRCPQRCGTGWPPLSPDRWAWCCDVMRRNLAFEALFTPFRREFLLRGKFVYHDHSHI